MRRMFFERRMVHFPRFAGWGLARAKGLGTLLLAVWLVCFGLLHFVQITAFRADTALAVLAIVAGALLLWER